MRALLYAMILACFAAAIHDHSPDCGDAPWSRANMDVAWAGAQATVASGIFDQRLNVCNITEYDEQIIKAWELYLILKEEDSR